MELTEAGIEAENLGSAIDAALRTNDGASLLGLLAVSRVTVNPARGAIQVLACDGESVVGHVQVSAGQLALLGAGDPSWTVLAAASPD